MSKMPLRLILITLIFSLLQACALIKPTPVEFNNKINSLLSENRYDDIDDAFNSVSNDTAFQAIINRKAEIYLKKQAYIDNVSSTALQHKSNNKWQLAINTYSDALEKIKNNSRLIDELAELMHERDARATEIKKNLLVKHSDNLLSYKTSYEKLNLLLPEDYATQYEINRYEDELNRATHQLNECAEAAKKSRQYGLAKDCYTQAYKLNPSSSQSNRIETLDSTIKNDINKQTHSTQLAAYKEALKLKNYDAAKKILKNILSLNPTHEEAIRLQAALTQEINNLVTSKINIGKELYSEKNIRAALTIWKQASKLDPDNAELTQLITRAEKVSKKIETLEQNQ